MSQATEQEPTPAAEKSAKLPEYSNILSKVGIPAEPRDLSLKERTLLAGALFGVFFGLPVLGVLIMRAMGS